MYVPRGGKMVSAGRTLHRLSIFLPSLDGGGAEKIMVFLANRLAARGLAVDLVLARATGPRLSDISDQVTVVDLGASRISKSVPRLARYLRKTRPDAVLSALTHANVTAVAAAKLSGYKGRLVVSERNSLTHIEKASGLKAKLRTALARRAYLASDCVLAVSEALEHELADFLGPRAPEIRTIYNPIDQVAIAEKAKADPDAPLPGAADDRIVAIGRLEPQKGFDTLIQAFAAMQGNEKKHLIILGEGKLRAALEAQVASLGLTGRVHLPGFVKNVYSVLARAKVFALSSRYEGLPNALLEALACGCHAVSTDCPTGPSEILRSNADGHLVPVDDVQALSQALSEALSEPGRKDASTILDRFHPDRIVEAYLDALSCEQAAPDLVPEVS